MRMEGSQLVFLFLFYSQEVIEVSKKYLPGLATSFSNPRLTVHVGDGFEFMKKNNGAFDIIITDSSDPIGPAESLFEKSYYSLMKSALKPNGIICSQGNAMVSFKTCEMFCLLYSMPTNLFMKVCMT